MAAPTSPNICALIRSSSWTAEELAEIVQCVAAELQSSDWTGWDTSLCVESLDIAADHIERVLPIATDPNEQRDALASWGRAQVEVQQ